MNGPLRFGVIGAGRVGTLHCELLAHGVEGAAVSAVCDVDRDRAAAAAALARGAIAIADPAELIGSPDVDAVAICSATDTHAELIEAAAAAAKPVFCEKPVANEPAAVERACAAAERAGIVFQVGFNRRFDPAHRAVHDAVNEGEIGTPQLLRITSRDPEPPPRDYVEVSGGLYLDMSAHDFDMARFVAGSEVTEVFSRGAAAIDPSLEEIGDVDTALTVLVHANGCLTAIDNSRRAAYGYDQRVEAFGPGGMACSENPPPFPARTLTASGDRTPPPAQFFLDRYRESYRRGWEAFLAAVAGGESASVGADDARAALAIGLAARRSRAEGRAVTVAEAGA